MAHSLSAKKRIRQNERRRVLNRARKGVVKTQVKRFMSLVQQGSDPSTAEQALRESQKKLDRLAHNGCIHRNTAARRKARLQRMYNAMQANA